MGSKNHEVVPTPLITQLSGLRGGSGVHKCISTLAKANLIARLKNAKYDGYRLTYGGLDYLSLHTHQKRDILYSTGQQIGTGKESDIHIAASPTGVQYALKIHRLGRISFRTIKNNRDYLRHRSSASWMYMSRLAAVKEYTFMTALHENGFPVPRPVAQSRHTLVMELIEGLPLRQVQEVPHPERLYAELINLVLELAGVGLIHGDFNEFNILIREDQITSVPQEQASSSPTNSPCSVPQETPQDSIKLTPIIIDFPQMLSIDHPNAEMYFDRDINCIKRFFERRFHFTSDEPGPFFVEARNRAATIAPKSRGRVQKQKGIKQGQKGQKSDSKSLTTEKSNQNGESLQGRRLDIEVEASGFSRKMAKELEKYMKEFGVDGDGNDVDDVRSDLEGSGEDELAQDSELNGEDNESLGKKEGSVSVNITRLPICL